MKRRSVLNRDSCLSSAFGTVKKGGKEGAAASSCDRTSSVTTVDTEGNYLNSFSSIPGAVEADMKRVSKSRWMLLSSLNFTYHHIFITIIISLSLQGIVVGRRTMFAQKTKSRQ